MPQRMEYLEAITIVEQGYIDGRSTRFRSRVSYVVGDAVARIGVWKIVNKRYAYTGGKPTG